MGLRLWFGLSGILFTCATLNFCLFFYGLGSNLKGQNIQNNIQAGSSIFEKVSFLCWSNAGWQVVGSCRGRVYPCEFNNCFLALEMEYQTFLKSLEGGLLKSY